MGEVRFDASKRIVPASRRKQLAELDSYRARGNRFTIAQDARRRDHSPTTHPDRGMQVEIAFKQKFELEPSSGNQSE
jgi:hypothetical protein